MRKKVSADCFWNLLLEAWEERLRSADAGVLLEMYSSNKAWTDFMLAPSGLIGTICEKLNAQGFGLGYRREWYTIDALFVGGRNLSDVGGDYPSELHVLIEHENQDDLHTEMWKLIHWRCPLKVLFFYDWPEEEIARRPAKADWSARRVQDLQGMLQEVNQFWPEQPGTEYLLIIGQRTSGQQIAWRRNVFPSGGNA